MRFVRLLGRRGGDGIANEYHINIDRIMFIRNDNRIDKISVVMTDGHEIPIDVEAYNKLVNIIDNERKEEDKA